MARPRFDVALSFAGEQRSYVRSVADFLRPAKTSFFFDEFEQLRLWGKDLVEELDRVYRKDSRFVVMFISADYKRKQWTSHERRSALAAALQHRREYVLPVRFDDTDLDGLPPTLFYVDARKVGPAALGAMIIEKLHLLERSYEAGLGDLEVWRLVGSRFARSAFDGEGARLYGGRWTRPGTRVVYTANSVCAALLEAFAFIDPKQVSDLVAVKARLSLSTDIKVVRTGDLPVGWRTFPAPEELQALGTEWVATGETCVLAVPSVVLPSEHSYLLNPAHSDFQSLVVVAEQPVADLAQFLVRSK
jgi:RES domain-containing protein